MPKVIVVRVEKDRKQDRDLSLEVRFSAKLNVRKLNTLNSDKKKPNTCGFKSPLFLSVIKIYLFLPNCYAALTLMSNIF